MLGRQPSSAPAHLSRVPYILPHDRHTTHLPMYEADDSYRHAVGGSQLGSAPYAMKLRSCRPRPMESCEDLHRIAESIRQGGGVPPPPPPSPPPIDQG
ncbi:hypothetical protein PG989_000155 [Apiospora arundinis]